MTEAPATPARGGASARPYPGLDPYTEDDAELFFGREADIRMIVNNARAQRLVVLFGPSGVGKSSVLQAGVVREIRSANVRRFERLAAGDRRDGGRVPKGVAETTRTPPCATRWWTPSWPFREATPPASRPSRTSRQAPPRRWSSTSSTSARVPRSSCC